MTISSAYAAVAVTDLAEGQDFFARLLDRPADVRPMPSLAQWDIGASGGVQVVELPEQAGGGMVTFLLDDFEATLAELAERGIATGEVVSGAVSRLTQVIDPSGNVITLAEVPSP